MENQPTQEERRKLSDELIASAKRGESISESQLNPFNTSLETVTYVRMIQNGRAVLDSAGITVQ